MKRLLLLILSIPFLLGADYGGNFLGFGDFTFDATGGGNSSRLAFYSPLTSTGTILSPPRAYPGTAATFSRASAQYITDFEGVTRKVESESVAVEGSRVVTNLLTYSEDLSNAAWAKIGTATVTGTNIINMPAANDGINQIRAYIASGTNVFTVRALLSGNGTTVFAIRGTDGTWIIQKTITLTATPQVFNITGTVAIGTGADVYIRRLNGTTATQVTANYIQLENVTAQTNTNPGEYVRTTSSALSQCFSTTNGNTVDASGVVTEVIGTSLPQSYPERVNTNTYGLNDRIQVAGWWYYCTTLGISAGSAPTFPQGKAGTQTVTDGSVVWTIGGRLLLGYVSEPASTNKVTAYGIIPADTLGSELSSGSLTIGQKYQITARTDADFTADGAADNVVGTQFVATAATVTLDAGDKVKRVQWGVGEKSFHNGSSFVQNITGLTLSGDTAAILSIVTDQTEIEKAGLAGINPGYKVYKLDCSACSGVAWFDVSGTPGNTNAHSISGILRASTGTGYLETDGGLISQPFTNSVYKRIRKENYTPSSTGSKLTITGGASAVIYVLLPQLEELPYVTSIMPPSGATATRAATSLSYPTAGNLRGNDVTVGVEWTPANSYTGTRGLLHSYSDANNAISAYYDTVALNSMVKKLSGSYYSTSTTLPLVQDRTYKQAARLSSAGVDGFYAGVKNTARSSNSITALIGASLVVGSYTGGSFNVGTYLRNLKIWFKPLSDDRCKQLTL